MSEKVLMKGNEAIAEAAIRCGCLHFFGYPITPQTEVSAYMAKKMPKIGGVFLQAESEIAAINMVLGAAATGKRVMTSSSSPGISLKAEGISYIAGSDLPCVIMNIMRGGPGLGGIQPSQADYYQATKGLAHGDFNLIVLAPNSVQEMVDVVQKAFDLSDTYRVPAMILGDGVLGQMMEPVVFDGNIKPAGVKKDWAATGTGGKRPTNVVNSLYLSPDVLEEKVRERFARYEIIKQKECMYEEFMTDDADVVVVAYGATSRICKTAVRMAREKGVKVGLLRPITLWPFPGKALLELSKKAQSFLCVEMSMGQMIDDVKLSINCSRPVGFFGRTGGIIPTPSEILNAILDIGGKK